MVSTEKAIEVFCKNPIASGTLEAVSAHKLSKKSEICLKQEKNLKDEQTFPSVT